MRPALEKLPWQTDSSLAMLNRRLEGGIPFRWHHHPEFELTLTLNSQGQRFIGDHVDGYGDGDLVLVGPNLPHTWASGAPISEQSPHIALVIWFHPDWGRRVVENFVEYREIGTLLASAGRSLAFTPEASAAVRPMIERFFEADPMERLTLLLGILSQLATDREAQPLASAPAASNNNRDRVDRILTHIHTHYRRNIPLSELSEIAALSQSGLHRMFTRHTGQGVSDYLADLRIGEACARLLAGREPIAHIAHGVGYNNLAHFNRQFRKIKRMTPREYRQAYSDAPRV